MGQTTSTLTPTASRTSPRDRTRSRDVVDLTTSPAPPRKRTRASNRHDPIVIDDSDSDVDMSHTSHSPRTPARDGRSPSLFASPVDLYPRRTARDEVLDEMRSTQQTPVAAATARAQDPRIVSSSPSIIDTDEEDPRPRAPPQSTSRRRWVSPVRTDGEGDMIIQSSPLLGFGFVMPESTALAFDEAMTGEVEDSVDDAEVERFLRQICPEEFAGVDELNSAEGHSSQHVPAETLDQTAIVNLVLPERFILGESASAPLYDTGLQAEPDPTSQGLPLVAFNPLVAGVFTEGARASFEEVRMASLAATIASMPERVSVTVADSNSLEVLGEASLPDRPATPPLPSSEMDICTPSTVQPVSTPETLVRSRPRVGRPTTPPLTTPTPSKASRPREQASSKAMAAGAPTPSLATSDVVEIASSRKTRPAASTVAPSARMSVRPPTPPLPNDEMNLDSISSTGYSTCPAPGSAKPTFVRPPTPPLPEDLGVDREAALRAKLLQNKARDETPPTPRSLSPEKRMSSSTRPKPQARVSSGGLPTHSSLPAKPSPSRSRTRSSKATPGPSSSDQSRGPRITELAADRAGDGSGNRSSDPRKDDRPLLSVPPSKSGSAAWPAPREKDVGSPEQHSARSSSAKVSLLDRIGSGSQNVTSDRDSSILGAEPQRELSLIDRLGVKSTSAMLNAPTALKTSLAQRLGSHLPPPTTKPSLSARIGSKPLPSPSTASAPHVPLAQRMSHTGENIEHAGEHRPSSRLERPYAPAETSGQSTGRKSLMERLG